ncbi:MAG: 4Fe-4S dicluster domain-containing protein [Methanotrichaceae archaeon]
MVYVDLNRCIACHACEVACENEHGVSNIFVKVVEDLVSVPVSCRQCENATCVMTCYTDALHFGKDGSVAFDSEKCTGCGLCVLACPFGAVLLGPSLVHKCNLCPGREVPACVATCPTEALIFGDQEIITGVARMRAAQKMAQAVIASRGGL